MKKLLPIAASLVLSIQAWAQCTVTAIANPDTIVCGGPSTLSVYGQGPGIPVLSENFNNSSVGPGWASTPQATWNGPCKPGVDGTTYVWFGNSSPVPRALTTAPFNLSNCANAGVTICFDMLFAEQGGTAPCEGPDEPDEGVRLQYSTNGTTWTDINYFDPNGGNDPQFVNWSNWCFQVPVAALTSTTRFRWFQDNDSGADYDHWGLDNVVVYCNDPTFNIVWQHDNYNQGPTGGTNPTPVTPATTTTYTAVMSNAGGTSCTTSVTVVVRNPTVIVNAGADTTVCNGTCAQLNATAKVLVSPAKTPTYSNNELTPITTGFGQVSNIGINVTGLNMTTILPNSITQVCINNVFFFGFGFPGGQVDIGDLILSLTCPSGQTITLVPANVTTGGSNPLTGGYNNTCFVPAGGSNIASGTAPYSGSYAPNQPFNNLAGCTGNGVWTLNVTMNSTFGFGSGTFSGWNITFDDPEISYTGDFTWSPTTNMTGSTTLTPTVCPPPTSYTLTVSDTAGCVTQSDVVNVNTQVCCNLSGTVAVTQPSCAQSNGSVNVTPVPGGSYTFLWNDGNTQQNRTGLAAGTYMVTVTSTSASTCTWDTSITLNSNSSLQATLNNIVQPTCSAGGSVTAGLSGGTAPYTVVIDTGNAPNITLSVPFAVSQTLNNLPPGTVDLTVTDAQGCTASATVTLNTPVCCSLSGSATVTQPTCAQSNGSVNVTPQPAGSYTFLWNDGNTQQNRTGLAAGSYTVTVTTVGNTTCTWDTTIALNSNSTLSATLTNPVNPTCNTGGQITAGVSGGTAPYTVVIDTGNAPNITLNLPAAAQQTLTNLPAGTVDITVTDAQGCTASATATLAPPNTTLQAVLNNPVNPTCAGNDGQITAGVSGGTAPYTVTIDTGGTPFTINLPFAITQALTNLPAGTVDITVTDAQGCSSSATATLTAPVNCCTHTASAVLTQPACGASDGAIDLTVANGSGNYTYQWGANANNATTEDVSTLGAGIYSVTITDNGFANCFIDTTFSLSNANAPVINSVNVTDETCAGNDGTATVNASGGTGNLTYNWSNGGTSSSITGVAAGAYNFTVTDANNCQATGVANVPLNCVTCNLQTSAAVVPPACGQTTGSVTVSITTAGTTPYTYSIDGTNYQASNTFTGVTAGNYSVYTIDGAQCTDTVAVVMPQGGSNLTVNVNITNITCFGGADGEAEAISANGSAPFSYQWNDGQTTAVISPLATGTYSVTVTDNTGCSGTANGTVTQPAALTVNLGNDQTICEGSQVQLSAGTGFASYTWSNNDNTPTTTVTTSSLYSVTVLDANGCSATDAVNITVIPTPTVDLGDDKIAYEGQNVGLFGNVSGSANGATFNWQPDSLLSCSNCQNTVAAAQDTITYQLTYTDANGCTSSDDITLYVLPVTQVFFPNAFSPNGDGNNDIYLSFGGSVKLIALTIFNRWGEKVFDSNNQFIGWDGNYKGKPQPGGVYVYYAQVTLMNDEVRKFTGSLTLIR